MFVYFIRSALWLRYILGIVSCVFSVYYYLFHFCHPRRPEFDVVQPKTSPFSTCHLIWVNYKVLSELSQPISLSNSHLNSARHNLVIEFCREKFIYLFFYGSRENQLEVFLLCLFCFFNNAHSQIYFFWELTILWLNQIIPLSK